MTATPCAVPEGVVLAVVDLAGGGTQRVVADLGRALQRAGCDVCIVTNQTSDDRWGELATTADFVGLPGEIDADAMARPVPRLKTFWWVIRSAWILRRLVASASRSVPVLAFLPGTNVLASLACVGIDVPLILSERNDVRRQPLPRTLRTARRALYRTATIVTTNRPQDVSPLTVLSGRVPVRYVKNPTPRPAGRARPSQSLRIVSVGRLVRHKRQSDLLLAFWSLSDEFPDWTLRLVGDGAERTRLEGSALDLGLGDRVFFTGHSENVAAELEQGAIFAHLSEYEGSSNAVLEAMAAGLPAVVTTSSVLQGVRPSAAASPRLDGLRVFEPGDIPTLTAHLRDLMSCPELRDEYGMQARAAISRLTSEPLGAWLPIVNEALALARD